MAQVFCQNNISVAAAGNTMRNLVAQAWMKRNLKLKKKKNVLRKRISRWLIYECALQQREVEIKRKRMFVCEGEREGRERECVCVCVFLRERRMRSNTQK